MRSVSSELIYWTHTIATAKVTTRSEGMGRNTEAVMKLIHAFAALTLAAGIPMGTVNAETWPAKPLRAIVPFAAGSITDIIPRIVLEKLSAQIGQPIIVENRPGGAQTAGANAVAKAEPDGYTILVNSSAHVIAPALNPNLSYDPAKDFSAVIPLGVVPSVLVVLPAKGFKTVSEFIAAAKARPGAMNFASAGVGTATHLGAMQFQASAGIEAVHIPFKGGQ
jgi:tripartite-type tricarboxylate transporter receptor subunit TctC